jgi:hypothetical protein
VLALGWLYMASWGPVDSEFRGCTAFVSTGVPADTAGAGIKYGRLRFEPVDLAPNEFGKFTSI